VSGIVAIIPARYASTRLPGKPLVDLCGKPMVRRVAEQAARATLLTRVIVATDDARIVEAVRSFGMEAVMTPAELPSGTDRIAFVARGLPEADIIVNVQGDEPLIAPEMIDEAIRPLLSDPSVRVGTLVKRIEQEEEIANPGVVKVTVNLQGDALYFSRSPIPHVRGAERHRYLKHIGLYVFRRETLFQFTSWGESSLERAEKLEQLRFLEHGVPIRTSLTTYESIPVDTAEDAERVRRVLKEMEAVRR
jgi:3-deoxy-manno-octulosonate cytidylyltransferase (CMP-KDO synthetase)